jgi:hypothetical protein
VATRNGSLAKSFRKHKLYPLSKVLEAWGRLPASIRSGQTGVRQKGKALKGASTRVVGWPEALGGTTPLFSFAVRAPLPTPKLLLAPMVPVSRSTILGSTQSGGILGIEAYTFPGVGIEMTQLGWDAGIENDILKRGSIGDLPLLPTSVTERSGL